jgi:predicted transposase YbfD/YdcC
VKALEFPHVKQVFQIETTVNNLDGSFRRSEIRLGVTSLPKREASRKRLLDLARGHWSIENKVHWVRGVTYDEDRSQVRRRSSPHVMASLRNAALNVLRLAGATSVPKANRYLVHHPEVTCRLLGAA